MPLKHSTLSTPKITPPDTVTGYATVYEDSVDGQLKVKFSTGIVQQITLGTSTSTSTTSSSSSSTSSTSSSSSTSTT